MNTNQACRAAPAPVHPSNVICPSIFGRALASGDRPREEERIVAFLDLIDSTAIAEKIGNVRFHALLSDVMTCLSRVVAEFGGEVHRYVGDALIATWSVGGPGANARAISCLFACREALDLAAFDLMRRHAAAPAIRASLHCGTLVVGNIGGREIALVGDAMNTAARIEEVSRRTRQDVLVSSALLGRTNIPDDVMATSIGKHLLRGKSERLELFALERCPADIRLANQARPGRVLWACA